MSHFNRLGLRVLLVFVFSFVRISEIGFNCAKFKRFYCVVAFGFYYFYELMLRSVFLRLW